MKSISKRQSSSNQRSNAFDLKVTNKTATPKMLTAGLPFISDLEVADLPRKSLEVHRTVDGGFKFKKNGTQVGRHFAKAEKEKLDISCENVNEEELLSKRRQTKNEDSNMEIVREILLGNTKARRSKAKTKATGDRYVKTKKRRIHSMKETKDLLSKNDLKFPLTNEWVDYSSQRYKKKKSGLLKKKLGSGSRNRPKQRKSTGKMQFYSQSRKAKGQNSNFLRLSPKQNRTTNQTRTSLYSEAPSGRNFWSRTHKLTKNIQFELMKNKTGKKKKAKQDYLTLRTGSQMRKPFEVRYSITSKNKLADNIMLKLDRRNFNSVDWVPENLAKLERYSDMELFFKKRSKKQFNTAIALQLNKENIRGMGKKQKGRTRDKTSQFEVDLYSGAMSKKERKGGKAEVLAENHFAKQSSGEPSRSKSKKERRMTMRKESKKKQKQKVYSSLTEILRRESLNDRVSLKGIDSDYFDNIYQKLSTKLNTKKRGKKKPALKPKKKAFKSKGKGEKERKFEKLILRKETSRSRKSGKQRELLTDKLRNHFQLEMFFEKKGFETNGKKRKRKFGKRLDDSRGHRVVQPKRR